MDFALQEILFLAEILGPDRPEVRKCMENAARNPALIPDYRRHFLRLLKKEGHELHDLPAFGRLAEADKFGDGIPLGRMAGAKRPEGFWLPFAVFDQKHVLVVGATGSGKTYAVLIMAKSLIEAGWKVLILDAPDEYKHLCRLFSPDVFLAIDPKDLKINFLLPPPNVDPKVWRGILINVFRESMFLRDGACNELNSILENLARSRLCPTFPDLHNAILKKAYRAGSRRAGYVESLQNRSELLMNSYVSDALFCVEGHPLEKILIERSGCLRVGLISNDLVRNFYVNYVLKWVETYLTFNPQKR